MHVVPGNVIDAGVAEIVRLLDDRRGLDDRLLDVGRQAVEHARAARKEAAAAMMVVMMIHRAECRKSRARRRNARTGGCSGRGGRTDWIGKGLARGKDKRGCAER